VVRSSIAPRLALTSAAITAAAVTLSVGSGVAAGAASWKIPLALLALAGIVILGMERPALFLAAILLVRPLLDAASKQRVHIGLGTINLGGAVGVCVLIVVLGHMLIASRITLPASSRNFGALFALSAVAAVEASTRFGSTGGTAALTELIRLAAIFAVFVFAANIASSPASVRRLFAIVALPSSNWSPATGVPRQACSSSAPLEASAVPTRSASTARSRRSSSSVPQRISCDGACALPRWRSSWAP
jgi:hypothetical protein